MRLTLAHTHLHVLWQDRNQTRDRHDPGRFDIGGGVSTLDASPTSVQKLSNHLRSR